MPAHHFELGYDLWSLAEVLFITVALLLLQRKREGWLIPLIFVATLNRETGGIIVLLALLATGRIKLPVMLGVVWAITYGSIRLYYDPQHRVISVADLLQHNLSVSSLLLFGAGTLLFGWFFWTAWKGRASAPGMARRVSWATFVYLAFVAVWGSWQEWRLYMSLYPILLPLAMAAGGGETR